MHSRLPRGVRPRLEGKPRTPLSSRVATSGSWSPLSGLKGVQPPLPFGERTRDYPDLSSWAAAGTLPGLPQQGSDLSVCNCPIPTLATLGWSPGWTVNPVKAGPGYLGHTVSPAPSSLGLGTRPVLIDCLLTLDKGLLPLSPAGALPVFLLPPGSFFPNLLPGFFLLNPPV